MRKKLFILIVMLLCCTAAFSSAFGDFMKGFSFKAVDTTPLYKAYKADQWSVDTRAQYINLMNSDYLYQVLMCTRYEEGREDYYFNYDQVDQQNKEPFVYEIGEFRDPNEAVEQLYRVKTGFSFSGARLSYKDYVTVEGCVQGALNLVFDANNGTDCIGFDGIYFYGINADIMNKVQLRFGRHHYSGHFGDEITEDFLIRTDNLGRVYSDRFRLTRLNSGYVSRLVQYVRQDSLIAGVSVEPVSWLKVYAEADFLSDPMHRVRPWILCPEEYYLDDTSESGEHITLQGFIGNSEGVYDSNKGQRVLKYDSSYIGIAVNLGAEVSIPFGTLGNAIIACDVKANQEGQTMYQVGAYKNTNPWDIDFNALLGFEIASSPITAELIYHNGRVPLMNFFWKHCSYWSAGFSLAI